MKTGSRSVAIDKLTTSFGSCRQHSTIFIAR